MNLSTKTLTMATTLPNAYLRLLYSESDRILIPATDGQRTVTDATELFNNGISHEFKTFGIDGPGIPTEETYARVLELYNTASSKQLFESFGRPLEELCLTRQQIIVFCENHPDRLRGNGFATLFLFKDKGELIIARICRNDKFICIKPFWVNHDNGNWSGEYQLRVVVPATVFAA